MQWLTRGLEVHGVNKWTRTCFATKHTSTHRFGNCYTTPVTESVLRSWYLLTRSINSQLFREHECHWVLIIGRHWTPSSRASWILSRDEEGGSVRKITLHPPASNPGNWLCLLQCRDLDFSLLSFVMKGRHTSWIRPSAYLRAPPLPRSLSKQLTCFNQLGIDISLQAALPLLW